MGDVGIRMPDRTGRQPGSSRRADRCRTRRPPSCSCAVQVAIGLKVKLALRRVLGVADRARHWRKAGGWCPAPSRAGRALDAHRLDGQLGGQLAEVDMNILETVGTDRRPRSGPVGSVLADPAGREPGGEPVGGPAA